ncbi:hypothetical protein AURDEDRAFT_128782 [Auricularia subglabra TFB-10046 SS5]|nr:hypothetical protein AURDEDRAFT_128782 [Auricularia subglabra TFB-10046 SS5]
MEPVSHTTTTITTDRRRFKTTAPSGEVYYTTLTTKTREETVAKPFPVLNAAARDAGAPSEPQTRRVKTTTRTTHRRQVHRVAPYPGARPVRISSHAHTTTTERERIVRYNEE